MSNYWSKLLKINNLVCAVKNWKVDPEEESIQI